MNEQLDELEKIIYGWIVLKKHGEDLENYAKLKSKYDDK